MQKYEERDFFDSIRRSVKISYFIASIIPLSLLVYFTIKYVYPYLTGGNYSQIPLHITIILMLAVVVSILGLSLSTRATNTSISSLQNLYTRLNTLIETTKQLRETHYLDILLESIIKSAIHLSAAETGSLLLFDETGNLRYRVLVGEKIQSLKDRTIRRGEGIPGWVAEKGKAILSNDVSKDERYNPELDRETGYKRKSIICVPLIHNKEVMGVIEVSNKKIGDFTAEDERLLHSLADQAAISIASTTLLESKHSDIIHMTEILVAAQDFYLREKLGHARRVANYANLIGKKMGLSEEELKILHYACLLHDIGFIKMGIQKVAKNEPWEREMYIHHPRLGYEMIKPISIWSKSAELILYHHERYDGTGYPYGKKGEDIPLGARILSVAETLDVLTSKYSYKDPVDYSAALKEIEVNSGFQFDPEVVKALKASIKDTDLIFD